MAKRVTQNNARVNKKKQPFLAKHLDGPDGKAAKMGGLLQVWRRGVGTWNHSKPMETDPARMCEGVEAAFYEERFRASLDAQNEKHRKSRHKERIKDMDEYRTHPDTCPESTLFYIGKMDDTATPRELWRAFVEFWKWRADEFPQVVSLDAALHKEKGAPHVHERHVWIAHDKDGREIVSQEKALKEMGVKRPDMSKPEGVYNNAKMTYTARCREKLLEIVKAHGFEIIEKPKERGKSGLSQEAYITQDEQRKQREAEQARDAALVAKANAEKDAAGITAKAVQDAQSASLKVAAEWERGIMIAREQKAGLEREIGDLTEYKTWKAQKDAQERQEAAKREKEAQEARERQEAARKAQAAQERARQEQEARRAAQAAQEAARPKTSEEMYREAQAKIFGGTASQTVQEPPKSQAGLSPLAQMLQRMQTKAQDDKPSGPSYPGS